MASTGTMPPPPPDVNNGPDILIATLIVTISAVVTTILRAYVRIVKISNPGIDVRLSSEPADTDNIGLRYVLSSDRGKCKALSLRANVLGAR
jgi:hypothetical protein